MKTDLYRLSNEQYDSVFLSMHSIQNYTERDFLQIRGTQTVIGAHKLLDMEELSEYLEKDIYKAEFKELVQKANVSEFYK